MGSKLAVTDSSKHKIAKKIFFTDDKLVHRKVRKKFLTRDGVHRMVYSSGTRWKKYSCDISEETSQYQEVEVSGDVELWETSYLQYCNDYTFDSRDGFRSVGGYSYAETEDELSSASGYIVESETVYSILSVSILSVEDDYCTAAVEVELVAQCEPITYMIYAQGSDYFGIVEAEDGEYPESDIGDFVEAGANDEYCVMRLSEGEDGQATYYYVKIEE